MYDHDWAKEVSVILLCVFLSGLVGFFVALIWVMAGVIH